MKEAQTYRVKLFQRHEIDQNEWDRRVLSRPSGVFHQTTYHADYQTAATEDRALFFVAQDRGGAVAGQALAFERRPTIPRLKLASAAIRSLAAEVSCMYGPLVFVNEGRTEVSTSLFQAMLHYGRKQHIPYVNITPSFYGDSVVDSLVSDVVASNAIMTIRPCSTCLRHLSVSVDDARRQLPAEARTKINRAERLGIIVRECTSDTDFEAFYEIVRENAERRGIALVHTKSRYLPHWQISRPSGTAKFWLSEYNGNQLSAQMAYFFNGVVFLGGVSMSNVAREHSQLPANDYMQWHIIRWATENKQRIVDWVGLSANRSLQGINAFKLKWGSPHRYDTLTLRPQDFQSTVKRMLFEKAQIVSSLVRTSSGASTKNS